MSLQQNLKHEIEALTLAGLYFASWLAALLALKHLVFAEYRIAFNHWSLALVGALVLSKVVLVLEHVSLGAWVRARPAWVDVLLRTAVYAFGVFAVLVLEEAFEGRHEHGGFIRSLAAGFEQADVHHIWLNTICLSGALLGYNVLSVVRRHLGAGGLLRLFSILMPEAKSEKA
jgi:hypothetical protein